MFNPPSLCPKKKKKLRITIITWKAMHERIQDLTTEAFRRNGVGNCQHK